MENKSLRGAWGEALAAEYLRKKRYAVIACNYRCRFGEIDVIAQNRRYVVFVEVKLRKSGRYGSAAEFVDTRKQERLDVIEIYAPEGEETIKPEIRHLEDAFS